MPTPTPVTEKYIACVGLAATVGGVTVAIISGGFSAGPDTDDMSNNTGLGFYEDVPTIQKASFKMTIAAQTTLTGLVSGGVYPVLINTASAPPTVLPIIAPTPTNAGSPAFSGNVRLKLDDAPVLDVKAGVKYSLSGDSQGPFAMAF